MSATAIKHDAIVKSTTEYLVDPRKIEVLDGFNAREDFSDIDILMNSILQNGQTTPITIRKMGDRLVLVDGERRLRAFLMAIKKGHEICNIRAEIVPNMSDEEAMYRMFTANDSKPFTALEEAELFRRLKAMEIPTKTIANRIGRSEAYVLRTLQLSNASPEVRAQLTAKKINVSEARKIVGKSEGSFEKQKQELAQTRKDRESKVESRGRLPAAAEQAKKLVETMVAKEKRLHGVGGLFDMVFSNNDGLCYVVYNRSRHERDIAQFSAVVQAEIVQVPMPMSQEDFIKTAKRLPKGGISLMIFAAKE